jgi:glycosyltransferase involved in cell wall biosynthesis
VKVYVYPADTQGCGTVRLIWHANHLRRLGHDIVIVPPGRNRGINGDIDTETDRLTSVRIPADADVIVMQRVALQYLAVDAIPMMRGQGVAVVVDMDDDLEAIDPSNIAFSALHPNNRRDPKRNWHNARTACMNATMVTVSTPHLLDVYAPHGRGRVIRNVIPEAFTQIPHVDSDVIGWPGALFTHPKDMLPLGASIAQLVRAGAEFAVVGPGDGMREALGLDGEPFSTGPVEIQQYPFVLNDTIGIGIAPLADTRFNSSKSWLKPLEMMSLGIPWVGSPRAEYRELKAATGVGFLAEKPKDWLRMLRRLVDDTALREDVSAAGREAARAWTVEANSWRVWEAWAAALRAQRAGLDAITRR